MDFISFFLLGLSFGAGPCIVSCGPILITYIAGTEKNLLKGITAYLLFSLSRLLSYIALSILIFSFGRFIAGKLLTDISKYIYILAGSFIIIIGLLMCLCRQTKLGFCNLLYKNMLERDVKSIVLLGLFFGFLPCGPLLALFSYLGLISKSLVSSIQYALSFGLGTLVSPLLLLVIFTAFIPRLLKAKQLYRNIFNIICGLIMIFLGAQLIVRALLPRSTA